MRWTAYEQERHRKMLAEALESNKYAQLEGRLLAVELDAYGRQRACCLGVACLVYNEHVPEDALLDERILASTYVGFDEHFNDLPPRVRDWLGFNSPAGELREHIHAPGWISGEAHDVLASLAALNDAGFSFKQIARCIRANEVALATQEENNDGCEDA